MLLHYLMRFASLCIDMSTAALQAVASRVRLLTTPEAMSLFRSKDKVAFKQLALRSGIPFIRVGKRKILWRESDLIAFMDARTVGTPVRPASTVGGAA